MTTGLERIAEKARSEEKLVFTSLTHHISKELVWNNLCRIRASSAVGVDGQSVEAAKESFENWVGEMLTSVHRKGYKAPPVRRAQHGRGSFVNLRTGLSTVLVRRAAAARSA